MAMCNVSQPYALYCLLAWSNPAMTQQKIYAFRAYLSTCYMQADITVDAIMKAWGVSRRTVFLHASALGLKKPKTKATKPRVSPMAEPKQGYKVPEGASKTAHGYAIKVGHKTIHSMAG